MKLRNEINYKGETLIIDTCDMPSYGSRIIETIAMFPDGRQLAIKGAHTEDRARDNHAAMLERFLREAAEYHAEQEARKEQDAAPLSGKYAKLRDDLRAAYDATSWAEHTEDGGTCNFDSPALDLPRWNEKLVKQAAKEAGMGAFKWTCGKSVVLGWVFSFQSTGQGNRRSRRAEAIRDELKKRGYEASMYYQMD